MVVRLLDRQGVTRFKVSVGEDGHGGPRWSVVLAAAGRGMSTFKTRPPITSTVDFSGRSWTHLEVPSNSSINEVGREVRL